MTLSERIELIETLRQLDILYERTTQGSWRTYQNGVHPVEVGGMGSEDDYAICTHGPKSFANADWIATMHDEWPRIRELLAAARKAEALQQEVAEKDARIAALEAGISGLVDIARQGVPAIPPDGPTTPEHQAAYEATGFTFVEIRSRARALLSKESADDRG